MKTKELIKLLQEADPSGEIECCVGNTDIFCLYVEPAYWDGCLQVLERDPTKAPYYDIVGAKYTSEGSKLTIRTLSISDAIFDNQHLPVTYEGLGDENKAYYESCVEKWRKETKEICNQVEREYFVAYISSKYVEYEDFEQEDIKIEATRFYNENMSYEDKMPEDIKKLGSPNFPKPGASWHDRRLMQWDREVTIDFKDGKFIFKKL